MEFTSKHQLSENAQKIIESIIMGSEESKNLNDLKFHRIALKSLSAQFLTGDEIQYIEDRVKHLNVSNKKNLSTQVDQQGG